MPGLDEPYGILITGIGGTGVVTIGALLGMAAHLEGKGCRRARPAGMAQKGGAVMSHVRIAERPEQIHAVRIAAGGARLLLGCDIVVSAGTDALSRLRPADPGDRQRARDDHRRFYEKPRSAVSEPDLRAGIRTRSGRAGPTSSTRQGSRPALLGDSIASNLFMLGYAYQKVWCRSRPTAIERAIELNGVAVDLNRDAFLWGRRAALDRPRSKPARRRPMPSGEPSLSESLDEVDRAPRRISDRNIRMPLMPGVTRPASGACARSRPPVAPAARR